MLMAVSISADSREGKPMDIRSYNLEQLKVNTVIVGTGAAGYNAAVNLKRLGQDDILLISENRLGGTSRNTGSDKQTYYKLTLCGEEPDSVVGMARTLFEGRAVDGDIALCEAALSARCFLHLVSIGLPFPTNRYGEYVGYKTDHDPRSRATSIGPYTSREMTRALEGECQQLGVPMRDLLQVIKVLSDGRRCYGVLCLDNSKTDGRPHYVAIRARNVVYATGGPAGMYANSVYPESQYGASGLAFEAGVRGRNLTEWQFGLASIHPRWNVSGTYMQALPRFISTEADGSDEREFLMDFFKTPEDMLSKVFLKGYQWPFDVRKVNGGSSIIDILVYMESCKGRRVYLDFTKDPCDGKFDFNGLNPEAYDYLSRANAIKKLPIERLATMNQPAIDFYHDKGVDLRSERLEVALCSQHNNGGLEIDCWWRSNLDGFFVVGEAAGSHGVYRPGGSALNAGQVGSTRAAQYIASRCSGAPIADDSYNEVLSSAVRQMNEIAYGAKAGESNVQRIKDEMTSMMSRCCGAIRDDASIGKFCEKVDSILGSFTGKVRYSEDRELKHVFRLRDILIAQKCYASSMLDYSRKGGLSRGSALYHDEKGSCPYKELPDVFTFQVDDGRLDSMIQEMELKDGKCSFHWRRVRPIPEEDGFFENVWREFRIDGNVR